MALDISSLPVIDNHCHPYRDEGCPLSAARFERLFTLGGTDFYLEFLGARPGTPEAEALLPSLDRNTRGRMYVRATLHELSRLFGCDASLEEVVAERNHRASDPGAYADALFADAGIHALVVDNGFPLPEVPLEELNRVAPRPLYRVHRIENTIKRLLESEEDFAALLRRFEEELAQAAREPRCVGFKSIIAYRTGLDVHLVSPAEAEANFHEYLRDGEAEIKPLRDFLLGRALALSAMVGKTLHIHCGDGDADIRLERARPGLLYPFLSHRPHRRAKVVLIHGGMPWVAEGAYLAGLLPNVYLDLSLIFPFATLGAERHLEDVLDSMPANKVLYGSDGYNVPEVNWMAAKLAKRSLQKVLSSAVAAGILDEGEALEVARGILSENARILYGLEAA